MVETTGPLAPTETHRAFGYNEHPPRTSRHVGCWRSGCDIQLLQSEGGSSFDVPIWRGVEPSLVAMTTAPKYSGQGASLRSGAFPAHAHLPAPRTQLAPHIPGKLILRFDRIWASTYRRRIGISRFLLSRLRSALVILLPAPSTCAKMCAVLMRRGRQRKCSISRTKGFRIRARVGITSKGSVMVRTNVQLVKTN